MKRKKIGNRKYVNHLKVKILSLVEEAKIIRKEENRRLDKFVDDRSEGKSDRAAYHLDVFATMYHHRKHVVGRICRQAQLAYGFIKGRSYAEMEFQAREEPDWTEVCNLVFVFSEEKDKNKLFSELTDWVDQAKIDFVHGLALLEDKRRNRAAKKNDSWVSKIVMDIETGAIL